MKTLTFPEAAAFLKISPDRLRKKAHAGIVPGGKIHQKWVFIEEDLVAYIRSTYRSGIPGTKTENQGSINEEIPSGFDFQVLPGQLEKALAVRTRKKRRGSSKDD